jgi:carboxymethylenebutenolidase
MYDAIMAETIHIPGHNGDLIEAYYARPLAAGPFGSVVVIHHMPGYDPQTKEITRTFAVNGYNAICPNLYHREAPGASPDDAAATARTLQAGPVGGVVVIHHLPGYDRQTKEFTRALAAGGLNAVMPNLYSREAPGADPDDAMAAARASGAIPVPDERIVGEVAGAAAYLRGLGNSNGKIGVIGHCSGGRQSFLAAVSLPLDAAVDCYGAFVVGNPPEGMPLKVGPIVDKTPNLSCPLLGLFGAEDQHPSPDQVAELEQALKAAGKTYEFHTYEGAGHAFFAVNRPSYRVEAANDGWQRIWDFYGQYLSA